MIAKPYTPPVETADLFPACFVSFAGDADPKTKWDSYQMFFLCQLFWDWPKCVEIQNIKWSTN